ncbi:hypothetical protein HAX54_043430 [Datura stramonium]|uniref:Uncharacterized protein n=1 Tax=Datura stramonium TaxID=4076 RepID=A0ABS8W4N9_DATST|nr:hypothetical protein [Datura stramonium]
MRPLIALRVKGEPERGKKKRKANSKDESDGPSGDGVGSFQKIEVGLEAMRELLDGLPRPPREGSPVVLERCPRVLLPQRWGEDKEASDPGNENNEASS